ncbi:hypothetical protein Salat_1576700 [Sesamum alatum]|uniref:Uncharacterized protein n=1 Tax=Sesamum alatum TaxID=300844 RepID=A0AAE1YDE3_9LAMI|nr:hypothetical protein Salat_1576700 [Sesamum alatum]
MREERERERHRNGERSEEEEDSVSRADRLHLITGRAQNHDPNIFQPFCILSHVNLPHVLVKSKSLIAYRPLYAVLLIDMLIVAARLALYAQGREVEQEPNFEFDGCNWLGAIKMLEWGMVLHHTLRAILIDCSFYLAIVVCGLSLVH